jgi:N-acetylneuraminate lyase
MTTSPLEIIAAPFTPFHEDGTLNLEPIPAYAELLIAQKVSGVFVCGTTGEGVSLTSRERMQVAEKWVGCAGSPGLKVIVHVGHNSIPDAAYLAAHAAEIGADAISAMPPSFFRPGSNEALISCCKKVASAASELPFFYYHIPSMTGVTEKVSSWIEDAAREIPNFAGVKFTFEDVEDFERCRKLVEPRLLCYFGRDELFYTAARMDVRAFVGSTYNYAALLYRDIARRLQSGDDPGAERLQRIACTFIDRLGVLGFFDASKVLMRLLGVDVGPPRLPLARSPKATSKAVKAMVEETGLGEYLPGSLSI